MGSRNNESNSIKSLMQSFISENKLKKGMQRVQVEEVWEKLMGDGVSNYTESIQLQDKTLIIRLNSSVLREELSYGVDKIINMINEEMGEVVVKKILLV